MSTVVNNCYEMVESGKYALTALDDLIIDTGLTKRIYATRLSPPYISMGLSDWVLTRATLVALTLLQFRKRVLSVLLFLTTVSSLILLGPDSIVSIILVPLVFALYSSDYAIVQLVYPPLYDTIQHPTIGRGEPDPLDSAVKRAQVNYYAKQHEESGTPELDIIESNGRILDVRVTDLSLLDEVTEQMVFGVYFPETTTYEGRVFERERRLGTATVEAIAIGDESIQMFVTDWNDAHPLQQWQVRRGKVAKSNPYVKAIVTDEVANSEIDELRDLYESIRSVYHNREDITR